MKLTKKLESEILKVYNSYWDSYFKGDMRAFASLLHENVQLIGSSENEVFNNKRSAMKFYKSTAGQVAGKAGVQNRKIAMRPVGSNVLVIEQSDFYVLIDNEWSFYGSGRISTLLQKTDTGWKIIHEHGSLPDSKAGEGEQVNTERIKAENRQLREAVKRRTIELEHKNRELEIETALEKVRAIAMGMKEPADMLDVCKIISIQLQSIGVNEIRNVQTAIFYENRGTYMTYEYYAKHNKTFITETAHTNNKIHKAFAAKMLKGKGEYFVTHLKGKKVKDWIAYQKTTNVFIDKYLNKASSLNYYWFSLGPVALGISTYHPLTEKEIGLFKRFLKVFELAYRRYLDIEKAIAQAREAQIEAALERVRSRTMGMQKSEELKEVIQVVYEQFVHLNILVEHAGFIMDYKVRDDMNIWLADKHEVPFQVTIPYFDSPHWNSFIEAKEKGMNFFANHLTFEEKNRFYHDLFKLIPGVPEETLEYYFSCPGLAISTVLLENVGLYIENFSGISYTDEENNTLMRFGKVFQQTYTRFHDLLKAEAQAREAQIEATLERVRSSAMAMHNSNDISSTTTVVFEELRRLNIQSKRCGVALLSENSYTGHVYAATASSDGKLQTLRRSIEMTQHKSLKHQYESWKKQENYFIEMTGEELKSYYQLPFFYSSPDYIPPANYERTEFGYYIPFSEGLFYAWTESPYSEIEINILNRFKSIIELTFRRFFDLQKAEAQTREAKIEASLERVRSKAMAMHSPDDLSETVNVFFKELKTLGIIPIRCGVGQIDEATRTTSLTTTTSSQQGESFQVIGKIKQTGHTVLDGIFDHWKLQKEYHPVLQGEDIEAYYDVMNTQIGYPDYPQGVTQYGNCFYFKEGFVFAWTENKLSEEELQIFRRFTSVLSLTYRRFMDLKEAEARAIETLRQASLDRVRAEIASMRTTDDLEKITPLIWRELTTLGVPFFRCGVFIFDEFNAVAHAYLSTPLGKSLAAFHVKINNTWLDNAVKHWRQGKIYHEVWNREQFISWTKNMMEQGFVENKKRFQAGKEAPETLSLQLLPFAQGMLYVGSKQPLSQEEINIAKKLADDFGVAYSRYEDFKKLEAANLRKTAELEEARQLQLAMLPKTIPDVPNLDIAVYMQTATEVGGDYYDFHVGEDGTLTAVIGDATGHGMKAGTMVTITKSLFNSFASNENILDTFTSISSVIKDMKFRQLSMCLQMIKIKGNQLSISSAAMPPALIYRRKIKRVEEIFIKAMPLGTMSNFPYSVKETLLEKGDIILLMSDGFPELQNSNSEMYGYDRGREKFEETAEATPEDIINYLKNDAEKWAGDKDPDDDVTFVVIKLK